MTDTSPTPTAQSTAPSVAQSTAPSPAPTPKANTPLPTPSVTSRVTADIEGSKPSSPKADGGPSKPPSHSKVVTIGNVDPLVAGVENPAADPRNMRRIIAEDSEWSLATVPLLTDLGITHIVANFEDNSTILNDLLPPHKTGVLDKLPTTLPLKITADLIDDQNYWKRCCKARWDICDVSAYNNCWKEMYFERNLENIIEQFIPEKTDPNQLDEILPLSAKYVQKLDIKQLLPPVREAPKGPDFDEGSDAGSDTGEEPDVDHFNFSPVFQQLPFLNELHIVYGVRDCGMNFEWGLFQFTNRDCLQLANCLAKCTTLKKFRLHRSKVDDEKVRVLISHILDHPSLIHLDLSHNIISDRGARALGKFINNHSCLTTLDICDNQIRTKGAQAIAHALTKNTTLLTLNLRLNRLGDEGGQAICRALMKNETLVDINLGSNDLAEPSCAILSQVLQHNKVLRSIDFSSNPIGLDGGKQLQEGMEENAWVMHMDLRLTECGQESEYCINQILEKNKEIERLKKVNAAKSCTSKMSKTSATSAMRCSISIHQA